MAVATYTPLATYTIVGGVGSSGFTFSSISQVYKDLIFVKSGPSSYNNQTRLRLNNDSGTNYNFMSVGYDSSSMVGQPFVNQTQLICDYGANNQLSITNIMDYSATDKNKTILSRANNDAQVSSIGQTWRSTAAVTSIYVFPSSGAFDDGQTFNLYGVA